MRFLSVCSGIEAASVAWKPLGWQAAAFAEIEPFPCAVLAHHYPEVPNLGDITRFKEWPDLAIDLLVGGTPCQSFSVAGLRGGLADPRGNLALTYLAIADRYRPRWLLWENVPGVLSSNGGRDFGAFLGGLGQLGYGFAYRVLDAQFVRTHGFERAVPQRRRRVFVVGYLGGWRPAAAVLFDAASLYGDPAPRREARKGTPGRSALSVAIRGRDGTPQAELGEDVANAILTPNGGRGGIGVGAALVQPIPFDTTQITSVANRSSPKGGDPCHPIAAGAHAPAIAFGGIGKNSGPIDAAFALNAHAGGRYDIESETFVAHSLRAQSQLSHRADQDTLVAHSLRASGFDASEDGTGRGTPLVPVMFQEGEYGVEGYDTGGTLRAGRIPEHQMIIQPVAFSCKDHGADAVAVAHSLGTRYSAGEDGTGRGTPLVPVAFSCKDHGADAGETSPTLRAMGHAGSHANAGGQVAVAYGIRSDASREGEAKTPSADAKGRVSLRNPGMGVYEGLSPTLDASQPHSVAVAFQPGNLRRGSGSAPNDGVFATLKSDHGRGLSDQHPHVGTASAVRRLTPTECERLQGFWPGYTDVLYRGKPASDGPRYKALGNSMAVNCIRWIGRRIEQIEALSQFSEAAE